jgi:hypothetical protein
MDLLELQASTASCSSTPTTLQPTRPPGGASGAERSGDAGEAALLAVGVEVGEEASPLEFLDFFRVR